MFHHFFIIIYFAVYLVNTEYFGTLLNLSNMYSIIEHRIKTADTIAGGKGMENILDGLNDAQLEAVTSTEGFVRVIAGAGSGKTRALSHRFAYLVNELGILPGNILCVTFTNKSANEMRQRIHNLTGDNDTGYICTFHSFCVAVLEEDS